MNISLVGTYASPEATGLRLISSLLKTQGHQVRMIFLTAKRSERAERGYGPGLIDQFLEKVSDSDLIGVSLMTNTYYQAQELTEAIKAAGIKTPVVWGGVHPTVSPEGCIEFADIVCVGEGEWPMVDLADALQSGRDYTNIKNLWVKHNGKVIKNEIRPLFDNLDELPAPDYQIEQDHYVVRKNEIVPAKPSNMRGTLVRYRLLTTRGCPYNCAFCCNSSWLRIYRGKGKWVRQRSVANVISELEQIKQRFATVNSVGIVDDTFFIRDESEFEEFAALYSRRIGWPFDAYTHPATLTQRKMEILHECGCALVKMGIQSGCEHTNYNIFNRRVPNERVVEAMRTLDRFPNLQKEYHYIVSNPFESDENLAETVHFAAEHHRGSFRVVIFPLALFPGSELYRRAREEGILKNEQREIYERVLTGRAKRRFDRLGYHTMLLYAVIGLRRWRIPSAVLHRFVDFMLFRPVRFCLDRKWFKLSVLACYLVGRTIRKTVDQVFFRPFRKYRRRYLLEAEEE